jgi:ribosome recycling factor
MSSFHAETVNEVLSGAQARMKKTLEDLGREIGTIRTGRASLSILDPLRVDYYGTPTPINQLANLSIPEPALIVIQPWDTSQMGTIEKAIRSSDLGLNPNNDGKVIRLQIPPLTEERRKELVKHLHNIVEQHRVAVRNVRRDANDVLKRLQKDKKISEDEQKRRTDEIQKLTDGTIRQIDDVGKSKENEILEIR